MKVSGIVVEYNPLHNGHVLHLEETKRVTGCDSLVAVMSGNFVQRGEPALLNKWARTRMALEAGIDLVLELPLIYSISSAEGFAFGAVSTLNSLGIIDSICFGSEAGDISDMKIIADILLEEPKCYREILRMALREGFSYPSARHAALSEYLRTRNYSNIGEIDSLLSSSNNILGIEYLKSLFKLSSKITPYTIKRRNNNYNDTELTGLLSSATAIRANFLSGYSIAEAVPDYVLQIIEDESAFGRCPVHLRNFTDLILYRIRHLETEQIGNILDVSEGLEHKIKAAGENSTCLDDLIESIKNKRYTSTRIQRILLYLLLNITKDMKQNIQSPANYVRVLGFNSKGKKLLREISNNCSLPIITNPSRHHIELLKHDLDATDTYVLGYPESMHKTARQDLKIPPIIKSSSP